MSPVHPVDSKSVLALALGLNECLAQLRNRERQRNPFPSARTWFVLFLAISGVSVSYLGVAWLRPETLEGRDTLQFIVHTVSAIASAILAVLAFTAWRKDTFERRSSPTDSTSASIENLERLLQLVSQYHEHGSLSLQDKQVLQLLLDRTESFLREYRSAHPQL